MLVRASAVQNKSEASLSLSQKKKKKKKKKLLAPSVVRSTTEQTEEEKHPPPHAAWAKHGDKASLPSQLVLHDARLRLGRPDRYQGGAAGPPRAPRGARR